MSKSSSSARREIPTIKPHQVIECRGGIWRLLKAEKGFWELELIKQGGHFSQTPIRVWALPQLELNSLKVTDAADALAPLPTADQKAPGKMLSPLLYSKRNHMIELGDGAQKPSVAMHCAIDHKDWQFEPWRRIVNHLPFPRLLIADDVGLGKTTEAAIILAELTRRRRADRTLIICPQHLCEKWQSELFERFGLVFEIFDRSTRERLASRGIRNPWEVMESIIVSRDFVKRWENLKPLKEINWDMVIIDECHHFVRDEGQGATLLRDLAESIAYKAPGLILLSATPFTGKKEEFHSLLKLIDPKFSDKEYASRWDAKNPYLVRRLKHDVKKFGEKIQPRKITDLLVNEDTLSAAERKTLKMVFEEISAHKSASGNSWDHLLLEVAKKRLSSSWAALAATLQGDTKLKGWFDEKTIKAVNGLVDNFDSGKLKILSKTVGEIQKSDAKAKIVIFTESVDTQDFVQKFLLKSFDVKQVAVIHGGTTKIERLKIEDDFANPNSKLKILIATDTLSEGKDLQHACYHLIHFELPWSLVKIEQRNGRIDRLGQQHPCHIYNLVFDTEATPDQKIMQRLCDKILNAQNALGSVSPILESIELDLTDAENAEKDAKRLEKEFEEKIRENTDFWGSTDATALAPAPHAEIQDFNERKAMLDLMITSLGGALENYGSSKDEYSLKLPEGWDLSPFLIDLGGYPGPSNPWRVTFNPKLYLNYQNFLIQGGYTDKVLHFLSPIHPICLQIEQRFRAKQTRGDYPIFKVTGVPYEQLLVVELTARSPSSRIAAQKMVVIDLKSRKPINSSLLGDIKPASGEIKIPNTKTWASVHEDLTGHAAEFAAVLAADFKKKLKEFLEEHNKIKNKNIPSVSARSEWLNELWEIDKDQTHYQIVALLVAE